MPDMTIGERLLALKARSGLSLEEIARRAGYAGRTSVAQYFKDHYDPDRLDAVVAEKLVQAFTAVGEPPIRREEIFDLVGIAVPTEVIPITGGTMPTLRGARKDVPVYGTAVGGDLIFEDVHGQTFGVEQTLLEVTEAIQWVSRPPGMLGMRDVYALYVVGSSMVPRYGQGHPLFVDPKRPAAKGDDVVVQLIDDVGEVVCALVKTLVSSTSQYVELLQYNPEMSFRVPKSRVGRMHRVISQQEIFFGRGAVR